MSKSPKKVENLRHKKDKRTNIPTQELQDFVKDDELKPKRMLYPRDTSLDPQLVWKGKDEQDSKPLEVPTVPIYIQEKIQPKAIIEEVRAQAREDSREPQIDFFSDFNGIKFEELVDFYKHKDGVNWSNRMILGDSLLVMNSLAEKEGLKGKVQMIYMDPPYGIDFGKNWQVSTREKVVKDEKIDDVSRQPEQIKAFRDTWQLGVHSYLTYLRDRLRIAFELLTETGSIFVQIGDENLHLVRNVMDEIFGPDNAHPIIFFRKKMMPMMKEPGFESVCDYILWYQNNKRESTLTLNRIFEEKTIEGDSAWNWVFIPGEGSRQMTKEEILNHQLLPSGSRVFQPISMLPREYRENQDFDFEFEGETYPPPKNDCWSTIREGMDRLAKANRLHKSGKKGLRYIYFYEDYPVGRVTNAWMDTAPATGMHYVVETNTKVIERLMIACTNPGDLVLDPTCGSGTTAYVAEQWGRRWITIDTSRVAIALARTRLMAAKFFYYYLADSPDGLAKESEITGKLPSNIKTDGEIKKGFVYKRASHITLGAIANNSEIDEIHSKFQTKLLPLLSEINSMLKKSLKEWQVPRHAEENWDSKIKELIKQWWEVKAQCQLEIDSSNSLNTETEYLYDDPYSDDRIVRVTGPFTVESLSPHRALSPDDERPASEKEAQNQAGPGQFETMILENLKKAGLQGKFKQDRIKFARLEPYAGVYLHAEGEYTKGGKTYRTAVCIGPEHGTVGPELVREAAKEAVKGVGFDTLVVCGFALDPYVGEEAKEFGKLTVIPVKMNYDLTMGDELLKKTGAGNLFMIYSEPDIKIRKQKDGKISVEIKGIDVYDPTTGEIRSDSTDDIACWFIDTNYNDESFFVRHAYFCGADKTFDKLKRALRAEINEDSWSVIYSTKSRPFDSHSTGKIAVKVINHYGDEALKVYEEGKDW